MSAKETLRLCRRVLRELRAANIEASTYTGGAQWQYIASLLRSHDHITDTNQQIQILKTYLSYLESSRIHRELLSKYQGKGERSVEDSARLVGLKLPNEPR